MEFDFQEFDLRMARLRAARKHSEALELLRILESQGENNPDPTFQEEVLTRFVWFYSLETPPDFEKVEVYSLERERLNPNGYNKLQTAFSYYWTIRDSERTAVKAREAIRQTKAEGDTRSTYQGLGILGLALLDLERNEEALAVFEEIRQMVIDRENVVVGDETLFFEQLRAKGIEPESLMQISKILASVCRDKEFAHRLRVLSEPPA
jgi:tetratricopeptide (TPR) repeat protein